jgi:tetratricopeptide (TPR) repeat protein
LRLHHIMASKNTRSAQPSTAGKSSALRLEVERLIQKERYKDAVKQAKLAFKEEGTPENHRLLERVYFLRARQLLQLGMQTSAVEVAQHLLEFGVTANDWVDDFVRLLMSVGLNQQAFQIQERLGRPELKDELAELAADQAVIHPERIGQMSAEIARDATLVRQSLERLQAKDDAGAFSMLRDIARSSPLSEWKFFIRGLAAFQRGDAEETKSNWDRLDPKRKAFRITKRLTRLVEQEGPSSDNANFEKWEVAAFGEPVLARLHQVRTLAAQQEWDKVNRLLGSLRQSLHRIDPKLPARLTSVLTGSLIKEASKSNFFHAERLVGEFTRAAEPLAIDPNWNRLWAMIWDGPHAELSGAETYWLKYIDDLKTIPAFNASERALAQAMIWNHLAQTHNERVAELDDVDKPFNLPLPPRVRPKDSKESERARKRVVECLEQSLRLAPDHLPSYQLLVDAYEDWEDPSGLEAAAKRLLAAFPDDLETLTLLATHYFGRNEPTVALPLVQRARKLKPLDHSLRELEWSIRIGLARLHALAQHFDEGRAEFKAAEELLPESRNQYFYLARKVIFEAKAGQAEASDQYLREARAGLVEPTPLWLALSIEANRYRMTKATQDGYNQLWTKDLKKKCKSETAGEMASLLGTFLSTEIQYPGRDGHIKELITYLRRTTRLKYSREDVERVCEFLGQVPKETGLLEKIVKQGLKHHPESALLNFRAGLIEMSKGPYHMGDKGARPYLEKALKLAEASSEPKETELLPEIKDVLTMLNEMSKSSMFSPFFGEGPFSMPFMDFDDDDDDDYDDDDDDDFDPNPFPLPAPRQPAKKKAARKKK